MGIDINYNSTYFLIVQSTYKLKEIMDIKEM